MAEELATLGYVTYNIDYCLANPAATPPVPGYPFQVADMVGAVRALTRPGFDQGRVTIDPAKVATWGWSAGATLSAEAGVKLGDTGSNPVVAMAGWSGGYDFLDFRGGTTRNEQGPLAFLGCDPQTGKSACRDRARAYSAALNVSPATPPMSLWNSSSELVPIYQWRDMKAALGKASIAFFAKELPGKAHATQYTHTAFCPTVKFLAAYLGPELGTCVAPPNP
jgi:acetyl esterase/lipase